MESSKTYQQVQEHYGSLARAKTSTAYSKNVATAFGYSDDELNSIPKDANLGLSCGNPLAIASLCNGETVIDLGSGAGFDVFLASKRIGPTGRAIGIDRNKDMLARARSNQVKTGVDNVSFIEANIKSIPLEDGIADVVISNCVINLVPENDKPAVFVEMARLLKPGGRLAISDILARKTLSKDLRQSITLYVGCVAGASLKEDYERWLAGSGFGDVTIIDGESDLNVYVKDKEDDEAVDQGTAGCCGSLVKDEAPQDQDTKECCGGSSTEVSELGLADIDINEWVGSFKIFAVKF